MPKKIKYTDEPMEFEVIENFLPAPEKLASADITQSFGILKVNKKVSLKEIEKSINEGAGGKKIKSSKRSK